MYGATIVQAGVIEKTYSFPSPQVSEVDEYHLVLFPDLYLTGKTGEPVLPYQKVVLLLPPGETATSIEIIGGQEVPVSGTFLLHPRQAHALCQRSVRVN